MKKSIIIAIVALLIIMPVISLVSAQMVLASFLSSSRAILLGWWPADGNATDVSGHNHNGIISGGVTFVHAQTHQAFKFDGVNGIVDVGDLGVADTSAPFSIAAWIKPDATILNDNTRHDIVAEGSGVNGYGNGQYFVFVAIAPETGPDEIAFEIGSGQTFGTVKYIKVPFGSGPTFVAVTYDGTKTIDGMKIYINGTLQNAQVTAGSSLTGSVSPRDQWSIGAENPGPNLFYPFKGSIDDVKVFSCALSPSDVGNAFHRPNFVSC
jgi:hypothetical protein